MISYSKATSHEVKSLKNRALKAASSLLSTRNAEALSLRAIADEAGIGITSMYHYFDSKEALLLELAQRGFRDLEDVLRRKSNDPAVSSPIRGGARAFLDFAEEHPALFSLMFDEQLLARQPALREAEARAFQVYDAAVSTDESIAPEHRSNVATALWVLGRGMAATLSSYPDRRPPDEVIAKLFAGAVYLIRPSV
jgi:AcrR family transcriptional regulator